MNAEFQCHKECTSQGYLFLSEYLTTFLYASHLSHRHDIHLYCQVLFINSTFPPHQPIIVLFSVFRHSAVKYLYPTGYKVTVNVMVKIGMTGPSLVLFLMLELLFHRMGFSEPCLHVSFLSSLCKLSSLCNIQTFNLLEKSDEKFTQTGA